MYRISPGEAKTDLYGIGKGLAQVIDLTPLREQAKLAAKQQLVREEKKQKAAEARGTKVTELLKSSLKGDVLPAEQPYFADQASKIKDYVISKMSSNGEISPEDVLNTELQIADLTQKAAISKDYRENLQKQMATIDTKNIDKYAKEDLDKLFGAYNRVNKEDIGTNYEPIAISPMIEMGETAKNVLNPIVDDIMVKDQRKTKFTTDEANALIDDYLRDPVVIAQVDKKFRNAPDYARGSAKDYKEYAKQVWAPMITRDRTTPYPVGSGGAGAGTKKAGATDVLVSRNPDGTVNLSVPGKKNEAIEVDGMTIVSPIAKYDKSGNLIGGTAEDVSIKTLNQKVYDEQLKSLTDELQKAWMNTELELSEDPNRRDEIIQKGKDRANIIQQQINEFKKRQTQDVKKQVINLTKRQMEQAYSRLTGNYPTDILLNQHTSEVNRIEGGAEPAAVKSEEKVSERKPGIPVITKEQFATWPVGKPYYQANDPKNIIRVK